MASDHFADRFVVRFRWGAIWVFARPLNAFWYLASVLGLLIFKGTLGIITAVMAKDVNSSHRDGAVEAARVLMVAKRSAARERTRAMNQASTLIVTGPDASR
jgi:hypothetical protein